MSEQDGSIYKAKKEWYERLMASKFSHAEKTFVFCVLKRMYGDKLTSYPGTADIMEDGGFGSSGHFQEMRDRLVRSGAILADLDYHTKGATAMNYEYTLVLNWDGAVAPRGKAIAPLGTSHSTSGKSRSTPGASNTTNNTKKDNTINNTTTGTEAPVSADAAPVTETNFEDTKRLEEEEIELEDIDDIESITGDKPPVVIFSKVELGEGTFSYTLRNVEPPNNQDTAEPVYFVDLSGVTKSTGVAPAVLPQAQPEDTPPHSNVENGKVSEAERCWHRLQRDEQAFFNRVVCSPEQKAEAVVLYRTGGIEGHHWSERADKALVMAGVERPEPW